MAGTGSFNVLVVAGSADDERLIASHLGPGFEVRRVATARQLERSIEAGGWDLAVLGLDSPRLLETWRTRLPNTPAIVIRDGARPAEVVSVMRMGARDCFDRDRLEGLPAAALREIESAEKAAAARRRELELLEHNRNLLLEAMERARLFESLHELALAAGGEFSLERLTVLTGQTARAILSGEPDAAIAIIDESGANLEVVHDTGGVLPNGTLVPTSAGAYDQVIRGLQPVLIDNYQSRPDAQPAIARLGVQAVLLIPLLANRRAIGLLALYKRRPGGFSGRDAEVAVMVGAQLAPIIDAARAHADLERRAARQELISQLGRAAVLGAGEEQLAALALPALASLLNAESAAILIGAGERLALVQGSGRLAGAAGAEFTGTLGSAGTLTVLGGGPTGTPEGARHTAVNIEFEGRPAALMLCRPTARDLQPADLHLLGAASSILTEASRTAAFERSLRASEERFRAIFESAAEGVWQVDTSGRTLYANRRMAEILRCSAEELESGTIWDFTEPGSLPAHRRRFAARLRGVSGRYEQEFRAADGTILAGSVAASPIVDQEGGVTSVVALVSDLTERRAAEQALRESEEKSRFLAGMSHELRTPLNSILGFSQLLDDPAFGPLSGRQRRYLGHIRSQGEHLLELINDVLDLSKVSAGKLVMISEKVDLAAVAADVAARMRPLAENKSQRLAVEVDAGSAATADRLRVTQAVLNLVSNAVKYTPEGGRIGIRVCRHEDLCEIAVRDDGPGIAPEDQTLVFDEFSKLSSGRRGEGTGLGLSLTRRLVQAMGGEISLVSQLGEGSVFRIVLPAA